jgi:hypothetical protein
MATVFWGQKVSAYGGIHGTRHYNITGALRNTKKTAWGHSKQKAWNDDIQYSASP